MITGTEDDICEIYSHEINFHEIKKSTAMRSTLISQSNSYKKGHYIDKLDSLNTKWTPQMLQICNTNLQHYSSELFMMFDYLITQNIIFEIL